MPTRACCFGSSTALGWEPLGFRNLAFGVHYCIGEGVEDFDIAVIFGEVAHGEVASCTYTCQDAHSGAQAWREDPVLLPLQAAVMSLSSFPNQLNGDTH